MRMIPYGRQDVSDKDIDAVVDVLRSDWLTQGPAIERFESAVAEYCGSRYAIAMSSATAALHLACLALDVGPGDIVWTSPNSFVASANCALYCGASINFVDIDPRTLNISISALEEKLVIAQRTGRLPKVIIAVHFAGQSCAMMAISALARQYGIALIEDASHALGGSYQGDKIGSCTRSDAAVFSFHPVKMITTGEGGMVVTNRHDISKKLLTLRAHGITRNQKEMVGPSHGPWYYEQTELGYNYRITDIQAALGLSQLRRLDVFLERRREIARIYSEALEGLPLTLPWEHPDCTSAYHLYPIQIAEGAQATRLEVFRKLRAAGVNVNVHYIPIHTQPYYRSMGFENGDFPNAEFYYERCMSLPIFPALARPDQDSIIAVLKRCFVV